MSSKNSFMFLYVYYVSYRQWYFIAFLTKITRCLLRPFHFKTHCVCKVTCYFSFICKKNSNGKASIMRLIYSLLMSNCNVFINIKFTALVCYLSKRLPVASSCWFRYYYLNFGVIYRFYAGV